MLPRGLRQRNHCTAYISLEFLLYMPLYVCLQYPLERWQSRMSLQV